MNLEGAVVRRFPGRLSLVLSVLVVALVAMTVITVVAPPQALAAVTVTPTCQQITDAGPPVATYEGLWIDSNKPDTEGPQSAYLSFRITGDIEREDVYVTFSGFTGANASSFVPTDDPTRYFAILGAGESVPVYYYVDYTAADTVGLTAGYSIYVTQGAPYGQPGSTDVGSYSGTVRTEASISAAAGGSDVSNVLGPGVYVGQILTQTVTYTYGNNDNISFQPVGNSNFDDYNFRLVGNVITGIVTKSPNNYSGIAVGQGDQLYWPGSIIPESGTQFTMVFYWEVLGAGASTWLQPYAVGKSGQQWKYLMKTAASPLPEPGGSTTNPAPIVIDKTVTPTYLPTPTSPGFDGTTPGLLRYTVVFTNTSAVPIALSQISDALPSGVTIVNALYTGTDPEISGNSVKYPGHNGSATSGTVKWVPKSRYAARHYVVRPLGDPLGNTLTLVYTATATGCLPSTVNINTVTGTVGRSLLSDTATFRIGPPTLAVVSDFQAFKSADHVVVTWQTVSEVGTAGYYLERMDAKTGQWVRVSKELVPALLESPDGGTYSLVDSLAQANKSLTYRLVEVEADGNQLFHGPFEVIAEKSPSIPGVSNALAQGATTVRIPKTPARQNTVTPAAAHRPVVKRAAGANQVRIEVVASGLYKIGVSEITEALGVPDARTRELIRKNGLRLSTGGVPVPYLVATDGSALYFYAEAIDSIYTSANAYWLTIGEGITLKSAPAVAPTEGETPATTFVDTLHLEQDVMTATAFFHDPEADFWHWGYLSAGTSGLDTKTVDFDVPDAVAGVRMGVNLLGLTSTGRAKEHHVTVWLNGTLLGETWWAGTSTHETSLTIPSGLLGSGNNRVEIKAVKDSGVSYSLVALDSLEVEYERSAKAISDQLLLTASADGSQIVSNLSSGAAWVLDVSDPKTPQLVSVKGSAGGSGTTSAEFNTVAGGEYVISTAAGALLPQTITGVPASTLTNTNKGADYIVITAPALTDAAGRLAEYRAKQGLKTMVVTTSDIYDAFNYGVASPEAIKQFIAYASTKWRPVARYVVLAGEGSYDYKNNKGAADSLVPPLLLDTENGLAPSDVLLADNSGGDGIPEVAIGRLPVLTEADLDAALAKIKAYESDTRGTWRNKVVLLADNADAGGDFEASSEIIAAEIPSSLQVSRIYLGALGTTAARQALLNELSSGALLVNYVGHAAVGQLANEGLLTRTDVAAMGTTGSRLPVVTALTCVVGQYSLPGIDSLSEALVKRSDAGAIAVWAPTAPEQNDESTVLGQLFAANLFGSSQKVVLGDVVRSTVKQGAGEDLPVTMLRTYNLLGDPALQVRW